MPATIDLSGQKFGKLLALSKNGKNKNGSFRWLTLCSCGKKTTVDVGSLRSGNTKSCGCSKKLINIKHGESDRTVEYIAWKSMWQRCTDKNRKDYSRYGGRGIKICARWKNYTNFITDMGRKPSPDYSLDRINNNRNYTKNNCRWATIHQQANNKRSCHWITINNKKHTISEWAKISKISEGTIRRRIYTGIKNKTAIFAPLHWK